MSPASRMRAWGAAVASGHLVLGLAGWLALAVPPWFFGGCALLTFAVALLAAPLMAPRPGGGGGGGPRAPEDPDPPWWPGFERDFRAYAEVRERVRA